MTRVITVDDIQLQWIGLDSPTPFLTAVGAVDTLGWSQFELVPWHYFDVPDDRVQDYDFVGLPPGSFAVSARVPVVATALITQPINRYWGEKGKLNGVRVHASSDLRTLDVGSPPKSKVSKSKDKANLFGLKSVSLSLDLGNQLGILASSRTSGKNRHPGDIFDWIAKILDPTGRFGVDVVDPLSKFFVGKDPTLFLPDMINNQPGFAADNIGVSVGELRGVSDVQQLLTIVINKYQKSGWTVL